MLEGSVVAVTFSRPHTGRASSATKPLGLLADLGSLAKLLPKGDARE